MTGDQILGACLIGVPLLIGLWLMLRTSQEGGAPFPGVDPDGKHHALSQPRGETDNDGGSGAGGSDA